MSSVRCAAFVWLLSAGCSQPATGVDSGVADTALADGSDAGGATADARDDVPAASDVATPDHVVGTCSDLADAGTWEQVTPPEVAAQLPPRGNGGPGDCTYGTGSFVVDPTNPAVVYLGTCQMGIWKTTDCGAHWVHINTGLNGPALDNGRQWTFAIDPIQPQVLYTNSGYNHYDAAGHWDGNGVSGAFRSTNGGVDWQVFWPPADPTLANLVQYNFVGQVVMDPTDHRHLLVSWHAACQAPHPSVCIAETSDAGGTWRVVDGHSDWTGGEGQFLYFLGTTLFASRGFPWNPPWPAAYLPFWSSPESDGQTWAQMPSPQLLNGGGLAYDSDHHLLYSSNEYAGFYRVVTP
jgi:hypothetical protein